MLAKVSKLAKLASVPAFLRALTYGVAATIEHRDLLSTLKVNTVVDVGANKGQFALLARHLWPEAMVYSFEPLPGPADKMARLFAGDSRVRLYRLAIGPSNSQATMHISKREDSSSLLPIGALQSQHFPGTQEIATTSVKVARLDTVLSPDDIVPDALLKIDVQGYESSVIDGSEPLLPLFRYIYCEVSYVPLYEGQVLAPEIIGKLDSLGFGVAKRIGTEIQADILFAR